MIILQYLTSSILLVSTVCGAFVHPGALHVNSDFVRMRAKVDAGAVPWITSWNLLTTNPRSASTYKAQPQAIVYRGNDGTHPENYAKLFNDVHAAYVLGLRWKISGNTTFADASVKILNAWSSTLTAIRGTADAALAAGIYGYEFAVAAETMRSYSGWAASDQQKFGVMLHDVFYSISHDFLVRHNNAKSDHYWANWDLCNIAGVIAIGIFTDNHTMYNEGITYFKSGIGNGNINRTIWKLHTVGRRVLGQGQEAGRDQGHSTLDFALLGPIAQMAFNQGDDLFAYGSNKILAGSEYSAKYNLGQAVPYTTYTNSDVTQSVISNNTRGAIRPMAELFYAHYQTLKGLKAKWTGKYRDMVNAEHGGAEGGGGHYGSNSGGFDQLGYGTLTFRLD